MQQWVLAERVTAVAVGAGVGALVLPPDTKVPDRASAVVVGLVRNNRQDTRHQGWYACRCNPLTKLVRLPLHRFGHEYGRRTLDK